MRPPRRGVSLTPCYAGAMDEQTLQRAPDFSRGADDLVAFTCEIVRGPDVGKRLEIDASAPFRLLVGSGPACQLRLADPHVSRRHFAIELERDALRIRDTSSTNGTLVNGVAIVEARLSGGEVVEVGSTAIQIRAVGRSPSPAAVLPAFGKMLGSSPEMQPVYALTRKLARSDVPILIEGETGTGKEVLAEAIHDASPRAARPLIVVDCTTLSPSLIESELFGHEKGAFTGAIAPRAGVFEEANGGTLFIDEIGDLELPLQGKLLRAIERGEVRRVGSTVWQNVSVRVIAATRRDLDVAISSGKFRDDLFYRLAVGRIELPPLRKRTGDVPFLASAFWDDLGGQGPMPPQLLQRLEGHAWPGNVRELRNWVARALAVGDEVERPRASASLLPPDRSEGDFIQQVIAQGAPFAVARRRVVEHFEREFIQHVLDAHGGHVGRASAASGIGRRYFQLIRNRSTT